MTQIVRDTSSPLSVLNPSPYFFPVLLREGSKIHLKTSRTASVNADASSFFSTAFANEPIGTKSYVGSYLAISTTSRTTVMDVSAKGILTSVVGPESVSSGDYGSIWVTIDGVEYEWYNRLNAGKRIILGGTKSDGIPIKISDDVHQGGVGNGNDLGSRADLQMDSLLLTPAQSLYLGIGIPFETTLKVEVQLPTTANTTTTLNTAGANYAKLY